MQSVIPTVGVVVFQANKVLLVRHGVAAGHVTGTYGLPAGRLQEGESEREAAVRELEEETGLAVDALGLIELPETYQATIQRKDGPKTFSLKVFLAQEFSGELRGSDEAVPEWISMDQLGSIELLPNVQNAINQGYAHIS